MQDSSSYCPRRKEGLVLRKLGDDAIVYNPETQKVHVLNRTSLIIWDHCTGDCSLATIEQAIREKFHVEGSVNIQSDIEETLTMFSSEGLLVH
jgi:hypothetical protein